jgi:Holliday junction resolvase
MHHRADKNQLEIVKALREIGASVLVLSQVGFGAPDLLLGWQGKNILIEVKSKNGKLSKSQKDWIFDWRGRVEVVRSIEDVIRIINDI